MESDIHAKAASFALSRPSVAGPIPFVLFFGGYVALIGWFKYIDVYHTHFSDAGVLLLITNLFRVLFIFYLFCIVQSVGAVFLRLFGRCDPKAFGTGAYVALTFFAGTGPWHVVLLAAGYLGLLNVPAMIILTAPALILSFVELRLIVPNLISAASTALAGGKRGRLIAAGASVAVVWCVLLLVKGIYPGGSHVYYTLYFPAYRSFVEHGSFWSNEVWLGYFYCKGAALFFLGILATDLLAPQSVIFCAYSVAGLVIYLLARRLAPGTAWPIAGVLLFFSMLIYTPGWGEFGRLHEFDTIFVIGIVWMSAMLLEADSAQARKWIIGIASTLIAAIVVELPIGGFLAGLFAVLALMRFCIRDRRGSLICVGLAGGATALVGLILLLNDATKGLPTDLDLQYTAWFADVEKLYRSGALPILILTSRVFSVAGVPFSKSLNFLQFVLRGNLLWPLILGGFFVLSAAWSRRFMSEPKRKPAAPRLGFATVEPAAVHVLAAALAGFAVLTVTAGRGLSWSYYRFATFILPIVIVAGIAMWTAPIRLVASCRLAALVRHPGAPVAVLALCAAAVIHTTHIERVAVPLFGNAVRHALGMLSIDAAFQHQSSGMQAMQGRAEARATVANNPAYRDRNLLAGTYPGARGAYAVVGPGTAIWSLHANSYCMLPDCRIMSYPFLVVMPSLDRILWGSAEEARRLLSRAGVNYFLFSRELLLVGPLPLSPLFSPDHIGDYLGIRWTDGLTTLLTWSGPDTSPLDAAWIDEYRRSAATSPYLREFSDPEVHAIFDRLNATPHPWHAIELPLLRRKHPSKISAPQ